MASNGWGRLARALLKPLLREARRSLDDAAKPPRGSGSRRRGTPAKARRAGGDARPRRTDQASGTGRGTTRGANAAYAGDYTGRVRAQYAPHPDGDADPGEIVWAWVPFEEDHTQGKDRPTLIVGRDGKHLLGLMLTSKDHTRTGNRDYLDLGSGEWERQGRDSEVKLDRVLRLDESAVRREGAVLDRTRFNQVISALSALR
jgi:hypothetical protein